MRAQSLTLGQSERKYYLAGLLAIRPIPFRIKKVALQSEQLAALSKFHIEQRVLSTPTRWIAQKSRSRYFQLDPLDKTYPPTGTRHRLARSWRLPAPAPSSPVQSYSHHWQHLEQQQKDKAGTVKQTQVQ